MADSRPDAAFKTQILSFLATHGDRAYRPHEIGKRLNVNNHGRYQALLGVIEALKDAGEVVTLRGGRIQHKAAPTHEATGTISVNPQGFGFVLLSEPEALAGTEVFVRGNRMRTALHGDTVRVALAAPEKGSRDPDEKRQAEVLDVVERATTQTVGTFEVLGKGGWVKPDNRKLTHDVFVPRDGWAGATPGDKVVVSIDSFDDPKAAPEGRVLSVLGRADAPGVDVLAIAMSHGTRSDFPAEVEKDAEAIRPGVSKKEAARRLDLRDLPVFTIDPEDAKDFDDAIHTRDLGDGLTEVGIHIADVSHYVPVGSALDDEAFARATSTYLVDRVIPMLPEALSNGVCSLRPKEDKLTYSVILSVDGGGNVHSYEIRETVIHSKHRFTYDGAQAVLDGGDGPLKEEVLRAGRLAEALTKKRMAEGAIDFDVPEVRVKLDEAGQPVDIVLKERKPANRLIEEFMLLANRAVAEEADKRNRPLVYRIHDVPNQERIAALGEYVRPFGYELKHDEGVVTRSALNTLLREVKGSPEAPVIEQAAIRSMSKAVYSPDNIGHYGLGFEHYAHFTSPIRRYPDLIVHRLLKQYHASESGPVPTTDALAAQAKHCSEREYEATQAERESVRLKQVEYAEQHVGDSFDGVVVGVTKFGVFVEMRALLTEGLVHVREMNDDYWEFDPRRYALVGRNSGRRIRAGDACRVTIVSADPETRQVDLVFEGAPGGKPDAGNAPKSRAARRTPKARQRTKQNRSGKKKRR